MPPKIQNLEKKIFYILAGIILVAMSLMSIKSGISGDEETYHYPHGKNVYKYYASLGKDTTCLHYNKSVLHMYGPVFDLVTVVFVKIFKPDDEYVVRHMLNSITGWAAILSAALIAVMLGGWRAGIFTLLFMFLSPRFLGHSFNNPKDIPFTAAYIFTIFSIIRFLKFYPEKKIRYAWPIALGIGLTIGVRVGGILLAIYFLFFTGIFYLLKYNVKDWLKKESLTFLGRLLGIAIITAIVGYIIGIILWPYSHQAPISRTVEAMKYMEKYATSLKQVFGGKVIWSDHVPTHYLPQYILMTIPEFIIIGFVSFFAFFKKWKREDLTWYFVLLFVSIFPVVYIIMKGSNVYGGWRHVMFIFPGLAILAALGVNNLIDRFDLKYIKYGIIAIVIFLMALPLRHIIVNHPHTYIYYNSVSGGVKKAYGRYEMDYFYHSLKAGSEWLIENEINKLDIPEGEKVRVATNLSINVMHYFRNMKDDVQVLYIRYYERGNKDWDYAVLANSYINPYQLKRKIWPPANTIHTIDVDGKPVCAIVKRTDFKDLEGYKLLSTAEKLKRTDRFKADSCYREAISCFNQVVKKDPKYEQQFLNLTKAYLDIGENDKAINAATKCLKLYPNYDRALNFLGVAYLNKQDFDNAFTVFKRNMKMNPKNVSSYYYTGLLYFQTKDFDTALKYLDEAINVNGRYKPSYILVAHIYELKGLHEKAAQVMEYANTLP